MGFFHHESDEAQAHEAVTGGHHSSISHELLAAAASYEAAKAYEKHVAANGKPASHEKAKELLAAFSGAFVDHMVETKGLNALDAAKAKHEAKKRAEQGLKDSGEY